jgi:tetratricopeptide (TPR) repeat protein
MMRLRRVKRWVWATASSAAAAVVLAVGLLVVPGIFVGESLRPTYHLVATMPGVAADAMKVKEMELHAYDAVQQVPEITLVESTRVDDQRMRAGEPVTLEDWFGIARGVGAGRLVMLSLEAVGDSTRVTATRWDVSRGRIVKSESAWVAAAAVDVSREIAELVRGLFDLPVGAIELPVDALREAVQEYIRGLVALSDWDLRVAERHFERAVGFDPQYARAWLWFAQVKVWAGDSFDQVRRAARRAALNRDRLRGTELVLADALLAMTEGQFPQACEKYEQLVQADSTGARAWLGLAHCHGQDRVVVRDESSPSRWRFRSSYHRAVLAYEQALQLVPSFTFTLGAQAHTRLRKLLFAETNRWRMGVPLPPDTGLFAAYPGLDHDTLAFVPYHVAAVAAAAPGTVPFSLRESVRRSRDRLARVIRNWRDAFPDSSGSNLALARVLEWEGTLDGDDPERFALPAARFARSAAGTGEDSLAAAVVEARLLVKLQRYDEARALAADALGWWSSPAPEQAEGLMGLAALVGRAHMAADLAETAAPLLRTVPGEPIGGLPLPVLRPRQRLLAYASVGAPVDSIRELAAHVERQLGIHVPADEAEPVRCRLIAQPLVEAFPAVGLTTDDESCWATSYLLEMQWAAARNDSVRLNELFDRLTAIRLDNLPGELSIEGAYQEAWAMLVSGDTARAAAHLDRSLSALETAGSRFGARHGAPSGAGRGSGGRGDSEAVG